MDENLRILIVDDSALVRSALREMLESDPSIKVVGEAANGQEALILAKQLKPHVITMDVRMPVMDGLETTEQLMAYNPTPIIAITTLFSRDDVDISFKMLGAGALEVMEKPDISEPSEYERVRLELVRRVKLLSRVKVVTHLRGRRKTEAANKEFPDTWHMKSDFKTKPFIPSIADEPLHPLPKNMLFPSSPKKPTYEPSSLPPLLPSPKKPTCEPSSLPPLPLPTSQSEEKIIQTPLRPYLNRLRFPVVVIGASTGGPRVVQQILRNLPRSLNAAVIVVQHIAEGFSAGMVEWLAGTCALPVRLAAEGDRIAVGNVLVAPDSFHLFVQSDGCVHLDDQTILQRPSVDITMQTTAGIFGMYTTGVLLTGMGRDGAQGMQCIRRVGGYTIAQNEASCSIYGMPRAAIEMDAADEVLPPEGIIQALIRRFGEGN